MSIKNSLIEATIDTTSVAGTFNRFSKVIDNDAKLSAVFAYGCDNYAVSEKADQGAAYPKNRKDIYSLVKKDYVYSLVCYDAKTNEIINPEELEYEVLYNTQTSQYSTEKTNSSFDIKFNNLPKNQLRLTVRIKADNYLTNYAQLVSGSQSINHIHNIKMVNIYNIPDGVSVVNATLQQDDNGTVEETILNFPSSSTKYESGTFTIPAGTKFYDKEHNMLEGDIYMKIGHFSPTTAYDLFSPGYVVANIEYDGKRQLDVGFISAGWWSTNIVDANGRSAVSIY